MCACARSASPNLRAAAMIIALMTAPVTVVWADDKQEVLTAVHALIDAWREPSVSKAAAVLHRAYRAESWQLSKHGRFVFLETREHLLGQIAGLRPNEWDVRLLRASVEIDPNGLATVWARYVFYSAGEPKHCGYESYTLLRAPQGWQIVNFADSDTPLHGQSQDSVCPG